MKLVSLRLEIETLVEHLVSDLFINCYGAPR